MYFKRVRSTHDQRHVHKYNSITWPTLQHERHRLPSDTVHTYNYTPCIYICLYTVHMYFIHSLSNTRACYKYTWCKRENKQFSSAVSLSWLVYIWLVTCTYNYIYDSSPSLLHFNDIIYRIRTNLDCVLHILELCWCTCALHVYSSLYSVQLVRARTLKDKQIHFSPRSFSIILHTYIMVNPFLVVVVEVFFIRKLMNLFWIWWIFLWCFFDGREIAHIKYIAYIITILLFWFVRPMLYKPPIPWSEI